MSRETQKEESGFTVDTLKFLMEEKGKRYDQRIDDVHKELDDYKRDIKLRFIEVNEFRKSLDDLGQKMQTKLEATALQKSNDDRFNEHSKQLTDLRSRLDVGNPVIGTLQQQLANKMGFGQGTDKIIAYVIAIVSILLAIVGLIFGLAK